MKVPLKSNYHLADAQKEFQRFKLMKKTQEIKRYFVRFFGQLQQHLLALQKDGKCDYSVIVNQIVQYSEKLEGRMSQCRSLQDIFKALSSPKLLSFWDYELIKVLVDCGNDEIRESFIDYKRKLQKFFADRMIEWSSEGEKSYYAVIIDESIINESTDWIHLENRVKIILGRENVTVKRWENLLEAKSSNPSGGTTRQQSISAKPVISSSSPLDDISTMPKSSPEKAKMLIVPGTTAASTQANGGGGKVLEEKVVVATDVSKTPLEKSVQEAHTKSFDTSVEGYGATVNLPSITVAELPETSGEV